MKKPAMIGTRAVENVNWSNIASRLGGFLEEHPQVTGVQAGFRTEKFVVQMELVHEPAHNNYVMGKFTNL